MLEAVEHLKEQGIVIVKYQAPFDPEKDIHEAQAIIAEILNTCAEQYYRIDDLTAAQMDWSSFVLGVFVASREVRGSMTDPQVQGILVGGDNLIKFAAQSMKQKQYGELNIPVFKTIEEAKDYIAQKS